MGTFTYQQIQSADILQELIIIDGQQRITSMILFIKALYDLMNKSDTRDEIKLSFLKKFKDNPNHPFKLKPIEYDRSVFEKLMSYDETDEKLFSDEETSSAVYKNYSLFKRCISESRYSSEQFYKAIYKLDIVKILLDVENPQEIFESLNSTGINLTDTDLIRNNLLMPLDYEIQEDFYKKYWLNIEKIIEPKNMETFMIQYLITKRKSNAVNRNGRKVQLSSNNLYGSFKKFYELIYILENKNAPIILMYLYNQNISEEKFIEFVDILISLSFRAKICRKSGITPQFAGNVILKLYEKNQFENTVNEFWDAITFGTGDYTFPKDDEFLTELTTKNLYRNRKSDGCKYLLYSLEKNFGHSKELPDYNNENISIEHIMPQKLNSDWKKYLDSKNDLRLFRKSIIILLQLQKNRSFFNRRSLESCSYRH